MAFFDDRKFVLSHIRHSFITSDETGVCETTMNELMPHHLPDEPDADLLDDIYTETASELDGNAVSYTVGQDMEHGHRRRSNTAQRLERLRAERKKMDKIKVIPWRDHKDATQFTQEELNSLFPQKAIKCSGSHSPSVKSKKKATSATKSALSAQIEKCPSVPANPFIEYARIDSRAIESLGTVRLNIFLTMQANPRQAMVVVVSKSAFVSDVIGLICWQYTHENREPPLKPHIERYSLRICEDSGEVDEDFPSLNHTEPVFKFGFPSLALVERKEDEPQNSKERHSLPLNVDSASVSDGSSTVFPVEMAKRTASKSRAQPGFEPGTSRTRSENHTPRPLSHRPVSVLANITSLAERTSGRVRRFHLPAWTKFKFRKN